MFTTELSKRPDHPPTLANALMYAYDEPYSAYQ